MDFLFSRFYTLSGLINIEVIAELLRATPFVFIITIMLFCCVLLLMSVFSRYKILSLRAVFAWLCACGITLFFLVNASIDSDKLIHAVNSQIILSFFSSIILLIFYLLNLINKKPNRPKKNFGYNAWWISIVGFIVLLAFYCIFNIALFIATTLFYL